MNVSRDILKPFADYVKNFMEKIKELAAKNTKVAGGRIIKPFLRAPSCNFVAKKKEGI